MSRKAQISGFGDLQWAIVIIIMIFVFWILAVSISADKANSSAQLIHWESGVLAVSYAQQPVAGTTYLQALTNPDNDEALEEKTRELLEFTETDKQQSIWVVAVRNDTRVVCLRKDVRQQAIEECSDTTTSQAPSSVQISRQDVVRRAIYGFHKNSQQLKESLPTGVSSQFVLGLDKQYILVVSG